MGNPVFRKACLQDADAVCGIIAAAKLRMRSSGRTQWQGDYPSAANITDDIASGYGYVLEEEGSVVAYCAVVFDGEPAYSHLEGEWLSENAYVVVHRMAVAEHKLGKGFSRLMFSNIESLALSRGLHSFKVDTNHDNLQMRHILPSLGFTVCGTIRYADGPRIAYEKLL